MILNYPRISILFTPAWPATVLLFGMVYAFAAVYFLAIPWSRSITVTIYTLPLVWVLALMWRNRHSLLPATSIDLLFIGFILWVLVSLVLQGGLQGGGMLYARFLPIMVIVPYLCGRLMRALDLELLSRFALYAGLGILPFLLPGHEAVDSARGNYFGQDHVALLLGAVLAVALLALCARQSDSHNLLGGGNKSRLFHYGLIALITGFLVWVSARAWLLAAIVGLGVLVLSVFRNRGLCGAYSRKLAFVVVVVLVSLAVLPRAGQFYSLLLTAPTQLAPTQAMGPILGEESCQPFKDGANSVAIRWVLYREALAMSAKFPVYGVGATKFGDSSCAGHLAYPHNSILQGFAELGLVGGGLLLGLYLFALVTLGRRVVSARGYTNTLATPFALALFAAFLVVDQFYGNYMMSIGVNLMLGLTAGILAHEKRGDIAHA